MAAPLRQRALASLERILRRHRCFSSSAVNSKGLVAGVFEASEEGGLPELSPAAHHFDKVSEGKLTRDLKVLSRDLKKGKCRILYNSGWEYERIAVVCLGPRGVGYNPQEELEEGRENIRSAVAVGARQLREVGESDIFLDPCGDPEAAAEGCILSLFAYDELKDKKKQKPHVITRCYTDHCPGERQKIEQRWHRGQLLAESQNLGRKLMEMPANKLTPLIFSQIVTECLTSHGITVKVRDQEWMESERMGAFLSVARGSDEPPMFVELQYMGGEAESPLLALVGKGVTFDSGGISLKPGANMDAMRGDMGGAACVVGAMSAIARLNLPVNIRGFIPLCENMPSGKATKPGDVVTARNGKTIQVDNTDAEGRLLLADALNYAESFNPFLILDMATLTGAIDVALGSAVTGVYTNSSSMWSHLHQAGQLTGDRMWRMPLFNHYTKQVTDSQLADVNNIGKGGRSGGSCTAAAFLREFVTNENWLHLDIAGVMMNKDEVPYLGKGMTGRPIRTIVEFAQRVRKTPS